MIVPRPSHFWQLMPQEYRTQDFSSVRQPTDGNLPICFNFGITHAPMILGRRGSESFPTKRPSHRE
jgi:hypothetical protein